MTPDENLRAWCVDRAIAITSLHVQTRTTPPDDVVALAADIEAFIKGVPEGVPVH